MARAMTQDEIFDLAYRLSTGAQPDARECLHLLGFEADPPEDMGSLGNAGVYVHTDPRHDMHILKSCGFLIFPEIES